MTAVKNGVELKFVSIDFKNGCEKLREVITGHSRASEQPPRELKSDE